MLKLYLLRNLIVVEQSGSYYRLQEEWDWLFNQDDLVASIQSRIASSTQLVAPPVDKDLVAPIDSQQVWGAGVTYTRSRDARMDEAKQAGGGDFYDRVYDATRPELFYKGSRHTTVGQGAHVRIRRDSKWNVPEPELALAINSNAKIIGYTIGNDMSSRDIEGENPLYLPQAKVYDRSCGLGPGIVVLDKPLPPTTQIRQEIRRGNQVVDTGATTLAAMKRTLPELVEYLFRDHSFPHGCFLLTGTGVVPANSFTLKSGDEIRITIEPIGTLVNWVE
jgi:2-dehydro-3-deoxy-D-arabinonate dehydratase